MASADQQKIKVGGWSEDKLPDYVQTYTAQVKTATEQALATNFEKFDATLYRQQSVAGMNYVVKVDTGAGDDKYVHVQFFVSLPPQKVEFKKAVFAKKDDPLNPL